MTKMTESQNLQIYSPGNDIDPAELQKRLGPPPPWRDLKNHSLHRADSYVPSDLDVRMVNYSLILRKPLFIEGFPGSGKSSLIDHVAKTLSLGPVLKWHINSRSTMKDGLYQYDAVTRMFASSRQTQAEKRTSQVVTEPHYDEVGRYITLGPLGTALLPAEYPRALLIDEIDKADIDLPNDLLNVLENGFFQIEELHRDVYGREKVRVRKSEGFRVSQNDPIPEESGLPAESESVDQGNSRTRHSPYAEIPKSGVQATAFPFIIITSNEEREMPPAFLRRCIRYRMGAPTPEQLLQIVRKHFETTRTSDSGQTPIYDDHQWNALIKRFRKGDSSSYQSVDSLLNAILILLNSQNGELPSIDIGKIKNNLFDRIYTDLIDQTGTSVDVH